LALAMLLPMTPRFLLVALRPDRPCWNAMVMLLEGFAGGKPGVGPGGGRYETARMSLNLTMP
jgi:hypothetical protein